MNESEVKAKVEKVIARNENIQRKNENSKDVKDVKEQFAEFLKSSMFIMFSQLNQALLKNTHYVSHKF